MVILLVTHFDGPLVHHDYLIPRDDSAQPMSNTKQSLASELAVYGVLNPCVGLEICLSAEKGSYNSPTAAVASSSTTIED
jgi:hypothetical protein